MMSLGGAKLVLVDADGGRWQRLEMVPYREHDVEFKA
jgi:hypothetical protein